MNKYVVKNKDSFFEALNDYKNSKCLDGSRFMNLELGRIAWNIYTEISNRDLKKFNDKFPDMGDPFDFRCEYKESKRGGYPKSLVELCLFIYGASHESN